MELDARKPGYQQALEKFETALDEEPINRLNVKTVMVTFKGDMETYCTAFKGYTSIVLKSREPEGNYSAKVLKQSTEHRETRKSLVAANLVISQEVGSTECVQRSLLLQSL